MRASACVVNPVRVNGAVLLAPVCRIPLGDGVRFFRPPPLCLIDSPLSPAPRPLPCAAFWV